MTIAAHDTNSGGATPGRRFVTRNRSTDGVGIVTALFDATIFLDAPNANDSLNVCQPGDQIGDRPFALYLHSEFDHVPQRSLRIGSLQVGQVQDCFPIGCRTRAAIDFDIIDSEAELSACDDNAAQQVRTFLIGNPQCCLCAPFPGQVADQLRNTNMMMMWTAVVAIARIGSPAPQAMPRAAVNQTDAAVISPRTTSRRMKMTPPPMKPIPDTICAATRDGSTTTRSFRSTSIKPYLEMSMKRAAETPTSV